MFHAFKENKNHLVIRIYYIGATIFNLFFYTAFLYFSTCNKLINFGEQHVYLNSFLNLIFAKKKYIKLRTNICGLFVLLFSVFMNIVSMLVS